MKFFLVAIIFSVIGNIGLCAAIDYKDLSAWSYFDKETLIKYGDGYNWDFDDNRIVCSGDNLSCHLYYLKSNKKFDFVMPIDGLFDCDLNVYLYKSSANNLYKVILIEGESERGTIGYYVLILDKNKLVSHFYINHGRALISMSDEGNKFVFDNKAMGDEQLPIVDAAMEQWDEIYITPKGFISIYNKDNKFLFKINRIYIYNYDETPITDENKYLYIEKTINK